MASSATGGGGSLVTAVSNEVSAVEPHDGGVGREGAEGREDWRQHAMERRRRQMNRNSTVFATIEANHWFQNATLSIIVINALWICVDVQENHTSLRGSDGSLPLEPVSTVIENLFCTYFTMEVLVRFLAFQRKIYFWMDGWFVFDSVLVLFMVIETWLLELVKMLSDGGGDGNVLSSFSSFRLLRLLRLTRMARIMRFFPELMTLVKGMIRAMKAVSFILLFLMLTMYVFAIVFTSEFGRPGEDLSEEVMMFASIGDSMMTLFTNGVLGDNLAETLMAIKNPNGEGGLVMMWLFIAFMIVAQFTLLNMLIGVLCKVISDSASEEEETQKICELKQSLDDAFRDIDLSNDGKISQLEWSKIASSSGVRKSFTNMKMDDANLEERLQQMQMTLFGNDGQDGDSGDDAEGAPTGLTFEDFVQKVVDLRWDMPANAMDVEIMKRAVSKEDKSLKRTLDRIEGSLSRLLGDNGSSGGPADSVGGTAPCNQAGRQQFHKASTPYSQATGCSGYGYASPSRRPSKERQQPCQQLYQAACEYPPPADPATAWLSDVPTELLFHVLKMKPSQEAAQHHYTPQAAPGGLLSIVSGSM